MIYAGRALKIIPVEPSLTAYLANGVLIVKFPSDGGMSAMNEKKCYFAV